MNILKAILALALGLLLAFGFVACKRSDEMPTNVVNSTSQKSNHAENSATGKSPIGTVVDETQAEDIFNRFFLIRPSDFLTPCEEELPATSQAGAVVILEEGEEKSETHPGDHFYIVTESSDIVEGVLTDIISPCGDSFNYENRPLGILRLEKNIEWESSYPASVGIRNLRPSPSMVGQVEKGADDPYPGIYTLMMDKTSASGLSLDVHKIFQMPSSSRVFVQTLANYDALGNDVFQYMGFLFVMEHDTPVLLESGDHFSDILAITDIDENGVAEVLLRSYGDYEGTYDIRLFDGKRLSEVKKVLYRWMD